MTEKDKKDLKYLFLEYGVTAILEEMSDIAEDMHDQTKDKSLASKWQETAGSNRYGDGCLTQRD